MKETRKTIRFISLLLVCAVALTCVGYVAIIRKNGTTWQNKAQNTRLNTARVDTVQGSIYDTTGKTLAKSNAEGERSYVPDYMTRRALSHTLGGQKSMTRSGVESRFATTLLGMTDATRTDYTLQVLLGEEHRGDDITLTISEELTAYAASRFKMGQEGALVLINYKTGAILCKISLPGFELDASMAEDDDYSYVDKVIQKRYAPGSTFKIVTLASVLKNLRGVTDMKFNCDGEWTLGGSVIHCAELAAHGELTLKQAFVKSCNITFASLAYRIGAQALKTTAEAFAFNTTFNFEDLSLNPSYCLYRDTSDGEVIQSGFGQGKVEVTPLHMAMISGAVANKGVMMEPKLIKKITRPDGSTVRSLTPAVYTTVTDEDTCYTIAEYMYAAVNSGTGTRARISGYTDGYVCGKTGSAEVSNDKTASTNAWYTGFLYGDEAHPYAIAVVVEGGGSGGSVAAPIASDVMKKAIELNLY